MSKSWGPQNDPSALGLLDHGPDYCLLPRATRTSWQGSRGCSCYISPILKGCSRKSMGFRIRGLASNPTSVTCQLCVPEELAYAHYASISHL